MNELKDSAQESSEREILKMFFALPLPLPPISPAYSRLVDIARSVVSHIALIIEAALSRGIVAATTHRVICCGLFNELARKPSPKPKPKTYTYI